MPYTWSAPELFWVSVHGHQIYHAYTSAGDMVMEYWYQIKSPEYNTGYAEFDIRDLAAAMNMTVSVNRDTHKAILWQAITAHGMDMVTLLEQLEIKTCEGETGW